MAFAVDAERIFVNLFVQGSADITHRSSDVHLRVETGYPAEGQVRIVVEPKAAKASFTLAVRIPGWARDEPIPLGLYRYLDSRETSSSIRVNGTPQAINLKGGYAEIRRSWKRGDVVEIDLPMTVRRVVSRDEVVENRGKEQRRIAGRCRRGASIACRRRNDGAVASSRFYRNPVFRMGTQGPERNVSVDGT